MWGNVFFNTGQLGLISETDSDLLHEVVVWHTKSNEPVVNLGHTEAVLDEDATLWCHKQ